MPRKIRCANLVRYNPDLSSQWTNRTNAQLYSFNYWKYWYTVIPLPHCGLFKKEMKKWLLLDECHMISIGSTEDNWERVLASDVCGKFWRCSAVKFWAYFVAHNALTAIYDDLESLLREKSKTLELAPSGILPVFLRKFTANLYSIGKTLLLKLRMFNYFSP